MPTRFTTELAVASREIARIRGDIALADSIALSQNTGDRERAAAHRASAYVWLASVLERIVRIALQSTLREITALSVPCKDIRVSLFALSCDPEFNSIADRSRGLTWETKTKLLSRVLADDPLVFRGDVLPLDGRTIRPEHFDVIWQVFGIQGVSVPSPLHRVALKDLADGRNEVAHGHQDPVIFGRAKATADVLKLTGRVDDVIAHLLVELDPYLSAKAFAR